MAASGFAGKRWSPAAQPGSDTGTVKQALVHAASVLSTRDRFSVHSVDMRPLVLHLLDGLQRAGIQRVVVALGENAKQIEQAVRSAGLLLMINYVYVPPQLWRNLANSSASLPTRATPFTSQTATAPSARADAPCIAHPAQLSWRRWRSRPPTPS